MTCREFKHEAASRSLAELAQTNDAAILGHAESCRSCGAWLEKQRALAASLHTLRAQTAGLEAGEDVERALLHVFRQDVPADTVASAVTGKVPAGRLKQVAGIAKHEANAVPRSTAITEVQGFAWHLSRLFEFGAYAAVAAAIAVAIFLGAHLLRHDAKPAPSQAQSAPQPVAPVTEQNPPRTVNSAASAAEHREAPARVLASRPPQPRALAPQPSIATVSAVAADQAQDDDTGYTALMFCDPLSCSSETQVVRMELPSAGTQPQMADVVVGFDGMVRAVRFVN